VSLTGTAADTVRAGFASCAQAVDAAISSGVAIANPKPVSTSIPAKQFVAVMLQSPKVCDQSEGAPFSDWFKKPVL
jgi:hypothetical protein